MISTTLLILLSIILFYMYIKYYNLKTKLNIHQESMDLILSNIGDGVVIATASGETVTANSIVKNISGMGVDELNVASYDLLLKKVRQKIYESNESEENFSSFYDCSEHGCTNSSEFILKNKNSENTAKITIFHNLSECSTAHQIIHRIAHYDSLTGLSNRNHIKEILAKSIAAAEKNKSHVAVAFIDLDNFKTINDTMGHDFGDMVLKHTSSIIRQFLGSSAYAGRLGGDEFLVVMPDIHGSLDSIRKMKELLKNLNAPINIEGKEINGSL
jgi:diguanylate cyclase (GGDEF)-like protein